MKTSAILAAVFPALASAQAHYVTAPNLAPPPGYSHAVVVEHGKIVYLSGAVSADAHGDVVGRGDFRAQATQAFENLRAELSAAGATTANLVKLNYFVVGLDHDKVLALRDVRDKFLDRDRRRRGRSVKKPGSYAHSVECGDRQSRRGL
jgi:enamine deaminase RidA (YjgF/YER057c/UK114 family)